MDTHGTGYVVLAAHRPDPRTFTRQLASIAAQTVRSWVTLVVPDSDAAAVREIVEAAVGGDGRFVVLDHPGHLGFVRTFERGLRAVPPEAAWVALSDQDDEWFPDKLARLLPHLGRASLVTGQALVTRGERPGVATRRRIRGVDALLVDNQVTGSFSVLRREVLDLALPFPPAPPGAFHDHWLGLCATALDGAEVIDEAVQRYHQHETNVIGEPGVEGLAVRLRRLGSGGSGAAVDRLVVQRLGWRRTMAATAVARQPGSPVAASLHRWAQGRGSLALVLAHAVLSRRVPAGRALGLLVGLALEPLAPSRSRPAVVAR